MSSPLESYGLLGDCQTAALVGIDGSVDWLCWPRFDSEACFAALLGNPSNGRWHIGPQCVEQSVSRRYRRGTLILETRFDTPSGSGALRIQAPGLVDPRAATIAVNPCRAYVNEASW